MRHFLLLLALLLLAGAGASAQTPFLSNAGVEVARGAARDSLGNDVQLFMVLTPGQNPLTGGESFNIETGESELWMYGFYSPAQSKAVMLVVLQPLPGLFYLTGEVLDSVGGGIDSTFIATNKAYSNSDKMAQAIRNNADYQTFREKNGSILTAVVALTKVAAMGPEFPGDFPTGDEVWMASFQDDVDTTEQMICAVSTGSGQSMCVTGAALAAPYESTTGSSMRMSIVPNPSFGRTRVVIDATANGASLDDLRLGLFDASGRQVLDLTESFAASGYRSAEFDASSLPAGSYFCRAVGGGFNGIVGTVSIGH
jgi:hypothetical protein